jgi:coenzyme F420-0:L-glutamate ligase / coenzyme F420-1:gamma-L-glutamate ligase
VDRIEPRVDFDEVLHSRRSIRRYTGQALPTEALEALLAAAMQAPSAHDRQPWRWVGITAFETKDRLARAMGARLRVDRLAEGDASEEIDAALTRSYGRITGAPALVVACSTMAGVDLAPGSRRWVAEHAMAMQSVAAAVENLLLAAQAAGLGACWMCAPLYCPDTVRMALDLPGDWEPQALITLGYPAEAKEPSPHLSLDKVVVYR